MTAAIDPLLEELNGALARTGEPTPVDAPQEQPTPLAEQLETTKKPTPRATLIDKTHAKAAGGHGYRVVVEGEYYSRSTETKGHVIKKYSLPFNLPALTNARGESALGMIVGASRPGGGMLKAALKKLDPLSETYRTHTIVSAEPLAGAPLPTSLQYMNFDALKAYVRADLSDFPINPDEYWDVNHLREDVIDFKTNQTGTVHDPVAGITTKGGFGLKKSAAERVQERHALRQEEKELSDMNAGL